MLIVFSFLAIVATSILFWRLTRALQAKDTAEKELRANVRDLAEEVYTRSQLQGMLQKLFDTSPNGIMSFRTVRDAQQRIVDFVWLSSNQRANEIVGRTDLIGKSMLNEVTADLGAELFQTCIRLVEEDGVYTSEHQYKRSGRNDWFRSHAVKMEDGFMVTFTDITEQIRAQESKTETGRLELTGQITRTIAHEVRNPLTNIHLAIEQIHEEVGMIMRMCFVLPDIDRNLDASAR